MHGRVQYPETIEPLVQFIEQTPPSEILDRTLEKLRAGVAPNTMLTASALAVVRSADLPPGHHGGPLHPLAGLHAITNLVGRLEGEDRFLPILQHVALSNKHINDPVTSPFSLLEFAPLDPTGTDTSRAADLANDGSGETITSEGVEAAKEAFLKACSRGEALKADHIFLWLWDHVPAIEAFDLLMSVALPKNALDDHYFLFPGYLWRGLETLGTEHLKVLFRPAVRYVARFPAQRVVPEVDGLIEEHGLLTRILRQRSGDDETAKIGELGEGHPRLQGLLGDPQADRAGAGRWAVAGRRRRGAVDRRRRTVPALADRQPDGRAPAHQRQPAALPDPARRLQHEEQAADLLLWHTGPEVKSTQYRMEDTIQPDMDAVAALPHRSQEDLLEAITQSIYTQPPTDWRKVSNLGQMRAVPEVKATVNLAQQYVELRYDPKVLIQRLAEIVCHDSFTEMHAFKHHQAVIEEFYATREPWRWMHLVCGCQAAAVSFGKNMTIYEDILELMHAA